MNLTLKKILFFFLFIFTINVNAEFTGQDSVDLMQQWQHEFDVFLLNHEDPNLRAYGVYSLTHEEDEEIVKKVKQTLVDLSSRTDLSDESYALLTNSCYEKGLMDQCDGLGLNNKYMSQYPGNLNAYLIPLTIALKDNDEAAIQNIMASMSAAEFINEWHYYNEDFEQALQVYLKAFPFPKKMIDYEIKDMKKRNRFSQFKLKYLSDNMSGYMLLVNKFGYNFVRGSYTSYESLTDVCENKAHYSACLDLAEILISHSHSLISKSLGYKIKINTVKVAGDQTEAEVFETQLKSFKYHYECLHNISNEMNIYDMNLSHEDIKISVSRDKGDMAGLYHIAEIKYEEALENGDHDAESKNPDLCLQESQ